VTSRLDRLRGALEEAGADAILIGFRPNVRYLCGFSGSSAALHVARDAATLFTDSRYTLQAQDEVGGAAVETVTGPPAIAAVKSARGVSRVGFEAEHLSVAAWESLSAAASGAKLVPTRGLVERLRVVKEPAEIGMIEASVQLNSRAFDNAVPGMRAGVAESEVASTIERLMRELGADGTAFESIVASGPRGALPHARASSRRMRAGEPVVVDIGAMVEGYASDMTRTVFVGEPGEVGRRVHAAVLAGVLRAEATVRAGVSTAEVDAAARAAIAEAGLGEHAYRHGTGHGVGLEVHEAPHVGRGASVILAAGMVLTIEPGVYVPEWGGVRIEDVVLVEETGCRVLTGTPREILTV